MSALCVVTISFAGEASRVKYGSNFFCTWTHALFCFPLQSGQHFISQSASQRVPLEIFSASRGRTIRFFSELKVSSQNWPFCFCVLGLGDCQMHSLLNCHSASASSEKIWLVAENVESYLTAAKNF